MSKEFKEAFKETSKSIGAMIGAKEGDEYIDRVNAAINKVIEDLHERGEVYKNNPIESRAGFLFEEWIAGTFNIDATVKGRDDISAKTLKQNKPGDIEFNTPEISLLVEAKTYRNPEATGNALDDPKYISMPKLVTHDQLPHIQKTDTYDHIEVGGIKSTPIDRDDLIQMSREINNENFNAEKYGITKANYVEFGDIINNSVDAGTNAALLSAAFQVTPKVASCVYDLVKHGSINKDELKKAGENAATGFVRGAICGSIAASLTTSAQMGYLGNSMISTDPSYISAATVIAYNATGRAIKLYKNEIGVREFGEACLRDTFLVSLSVGGGTLGQAIIPIPIVGWTIGSFVGGVLGNMLLGGKTKYVTSNYFAVDCISNVVIIKPVIKQNYKIPPEVLKQAGYNIFKTRDFSIKKFEPKKFKIKQFQAKSINIRVMKRGLIGVNTIGYTL